MHKTTGTKSSGDEQGEQGRLTPEQTARKIMGSASISCIVKKILSRLDWGRAKGSDEIGASETISLLGNVKHSFHRPVLAHKQCQIDFYIHSEAGKLSDDEFGDPVVGFMKFYPPTDGSEALVMFGVPCTKEYFENAKESFMRFEATQASHLSVTFMVNNFGEDWEPEGPPTGEPSLWVNHVDISWSVEMSIGSPDA